MHGNEHGNADHHRQQQQCDERARGSFHYDYTSHPEPISACSKERDPVTLTVLLAWEVP
jgi:hypothetical protein